MLPRFHRGAFALFVLSFLVTLLLGDRASLAAALTLVPNTALTGSHWWTPLSALFRQPEGLGLLGLLWTLIVQWLIGSPLEGFWGTSRYLIMVLVAGVIGYGGSIALALAIPTLGPVPLSGMAPVNTAAVVAFAFVFARESMRLASREISPLVVAGIAGPIVLAFPLLVALVAGLPAAQAWPVLIPQTLAALVATVFVQPWRKRGNSGKVGRSKKPRAKSHLRVVRTPEDMLN